MPKKDSNFEGLVNLEKMTDDELKNIKEDKLGFNRHLDPFINYINSFPTPLVVGIYGDWGSGKSTFVNYIKNKLESEKTFYTPEFDSLKCKEDKTLWKSFILDIFKQLKCPKDKVPLIKENEFKEIVDRLCFTEDKPSINNKDWKNWYPLYLYIAVCAILSILHINGTLNIIRDNILSPLIAILIALCIPIIQIKRTRGPIESFHEFEDILNDLKDIFSKLEKEKIFVTIENLDRVEPKYALDLLESIKMLLNFKNFVYLIPCDPSIIQKDIKNRYKDDINSEDYLSKIITVPFYLPLARPLFVKEFISNLINPKKLDSKEVFEIMNNAKIKNPRKIKKILREADMAYRFMISEGEKEKDIKPHFLVILNVIKYEFPIGYRLIKEMFEFPEVTEKLAYTFAFLFDTEKDPQKNNHYWDALTEVLNYYTNSDFRDTEIEYLNSYESGVRLNLDPNILQFRLELKKFFDYFKYFVYKGITPTLDDDPLKEIPKYLLSVAIVSEEINLGIGLSVSVKAELNKGKDSK